MEIKNIVAGKRFISKTGEEKTQWTNVGALFIKDDGTMSVKFNGFINPLAFANDKGEVWFNVFDKDRNNDKKDAKNSPKTGDSWDDNTYNTQAHKNVVNDAKAIAEKFRKQAEGKSFDDIISADENWFRENSENIPF